MFGVDCSRVCLHCCLTRVSTYRTNRWAAFDCAIKGVRKKEDAWNAISAGFLTGGSLAIRGGFKAARNSAIMCAVFLGVIEGVGIGFQRMMADNTKLEVRFDLQGLQSDLKLAD